MWLHLHHPPDPPDPLAPSPTAVAATAAVQRFWDSLADFCSTPAATTANIPHWPPVPEHHPFLHTDTDTTSIQVNAPPVQDHQDPDDDPA
jgi:hypothetical protein